MDNFFSSKNEGIAKFIYRLFLVISVTIISFFAREFYYSVKETKKSVNEIKRVQEKNFKIINYKINRNSKNIKVNEIDINKIKNSR